MNTSLLPNSFKEYTKKIMDTSLYASLLKGMEEEPPVSIRLNPRKICGSSCSTESVPWCDGGYYIQKRPSFTFDPLLHAGLYYVQEASSMFISKVIREFCNEPKVVLDLCAAPGGKSTCAISSLPEGSILISNEPIRQRAEILAENMHKWGYPNTIVTNNYPEKYAQSGLLFDIIICDVPCSGEGMFRKDPNSINEWSTQNVAKYASLQREIVERAWKCLKPEGLLIYSTCTFNLQENEANVKWICNSLGGSLLEIPTDKDWNITGSLMDGVDPVYRFIPGVSRGEGLFMAVIRKDANMPKSRYKDRRIKINIPIKPIEWLEHPDAYTILDVGEEINAIPNEMLYLYGELKTSGMTILKAGITIGTIKGKEVIPHQSLILSGEMKKGKFPTVEVNYQQAIALLQREHVHIGDGQATGFWVVTFGGVALGIIKNLGNRTNNLYPLAWRIKSSHAPNDYNNIVHNIFTI